MLKIVRIRFQIDPLFMAFIFVLVAVGEVKAQSSLVYDVVVYGGTPGGISAAVAAGRGGSKVALLEPSLHIGGTISGGLGNADPGNKEVVGGYALEFYERVGKRYGNALRWQVEPHVAEAIFREMAREAGVDVFVRHRLRERGGVKKEGARIESVKLENGVVFAAKVFIDATYEGDLMAKAGVSYTWGREPSSQYGESLAGVRPRQRFDQMQADIPARDADGRFWPEVSHSRIDPLGSGDKKIPAYNFRLCMTKDPANRVPFPKPRRYPPRRFALLARLLAEMEIQKRTGKGFDKETKLPWSVNSVLGPNLLPNGKTDTNGRGGFSTDYVGGNYDYPDGSYATRARVWQDHVDYVQGYIYFIQNDPRVPKPLRDEMSHWGLCRDEFADNGHWPYQLYVREARRMVGDFVMTQRDVLRGSEVGSSIPDPIGMGSFPIDSHQVQRIVSSSGIVENEGGMMVSVSPYQIPYRVLLPRRAEATNLLVTVCLSASHVAYSTLRMEPVYMSLGQAAGAAAKLAIESGSAVHDVEQTTLQEKLRKERTILEWKN